MQSGLWGRCKRGARARQGRNGAVSVLALAERGALFDPGPCMCATAPPGLPQSQAALLWSLCSVLVTQQWLRRRT